MLPMSIVLAGVLCTSGQWTASWVNDWDKVVSFSAASCNGIRAIASINDNGPEDRRWKFYEEALPGCGRGNGFTTDWTNSWDDSQNYQDMTNVIIGHYSEHNNYKEDRQFKMNVAPLQGLYASNCYYTAYTDWDAEWTVWCKGGAWMFGQSSHHDNSKEDRRYTFYCCTVLGNPCNSLSAPLQGTVDTSNSNTYPSTATYNCNTGYRLEPANVARTCGTNGQWSGTAPTCVGVDCPVLTGNTLFTVSTTNLNRNPSVATYSCAQGYATSGSRTQNCGNSGVWDGSVPTCDGVLCVHETTSAPLIVTRPNGVVNYPTGGASYSCSPGFTLVGSSSRTCNALGKMDGTVPTCEPTFCNTLSAPVNGGVTTSNGNRVPSKATYTCNEYYYLSSSTPLNCDSAVFQGVAPTCQYRTVSKMCVNCNASSVASLATQSVIFSKTTAGGDVLWFTGVSTTPTSVTFGPPSTPNKYTCASPQPVANTSYYSCQIPAGVGLDLTLYVSLSELGGIVAKSTGTLRFPQPSITTNSMRIASDESKLPPTINAPTNTGGDTLSINGTFFGTSVAEVAVWFVKSSTPSKYEYVCKVKTVADQSISCVTESGDGGPYVLVVVVGGQPALPSADAFKYADGPMVLAVNGCQYLDGESIVGCPTQGAVNVWLLGESFNYNGNTPTVYIDNLQAEVIPGSFNSTHMQVVLPASTGTNRAVAVTAGPISSRPKALISYAAPVIGNVRGCVDRKNCSRQGEAITIEGQNFGFARATVLVSGVECLSVKHDAGTPDNLLTCVLRPGKGISRDISVIQFNGAIRFALPNVSLSYYECPPGTREESSSGLGCVDCEAGWYTDVPSSPNCKTCRIGSFSDSKLARSCGDASPGYFVNSTQASAQIKCPEGTYQDKYGASECRDCAGGKYNDIPAQAGCTVCAKGRVQPQQRSSTCDRCPEGRYANVAGMLSCLVCDDGSATNGDGNDACVKCHAGGYAVGGRCIDCKEGQYSPQTGATVCVACETGRYGAKPSTTACENCSPGRFNPNIQATVCLYCTSGTFSGAFQAKECSLCDVGKFNVAHESTSCDNCRPGLFAERKQSTACTECDVGKYTGTFESTSCLPCLPGSRANVTGLASCLPCAAGDHAAQEASYDCAACPVGRFSLSGSEVCYECAPRSVASVEASSECEVCPSNSNNDEKKSQCECIVGYFLQARPGGKQCVECPDGANCNVVGVREDTLQALPGWYRLRPNDTITGDTQYYLRCLTRQHCLGGRNNSCGLNRQGVLCGECLPGYSASSTRHGCDQCEDTKEKSWLNAGLVLWLIVAGVCLMYYVVLRMTDHSMEQLLRKEELKKQKKQRGVSTFTGMSRKGSFSQLESTSLPATPHMSPNLHNFRATEIREEVITFRARNEPSIMYKIKIMVGFFQISNVIAFQGEVPWPTYFQEFLNVFSFLNFDFVPWQAFGCAVSFDFIIKAICVGCMPIIAALCLVCLVYLPMKYLDKRDMTDSNKYRKKRDRSVARVWRLALFTIFLLYPYVSSVELGVFNCINIDGTWYMVEQLTEVCFTSDWWSRAIVPLVFVVLYPLGIPLFSIILLKRARPTMKSPRTLIAYGFLYEAYNTQSWFFELVDILHKLLLTSLIPFFPNKMELAVDMVVITLYCVVLLILNPYVRKGDDRLHILVQAELLLLSMVGWTMSELEIVSYSEEINVLMSICMISVTCFLILVFVLLSGRNVYKMVRECLNAKKILHSHQVKSVFGPRGRDVPSRSGSGSGYGEGPGLSGGIPSLGLHAGDNNPSSLTL